MFYKYAKVAWMHIFLQHKKKPQIPSNNIWYCDDSNKQIITYTVHFLTIPLLKRKIVNISVKQKLRMWHVLLHIYIFPSIFSRLSLTINDHTSLVSLFGTFWGFIICQGIYYYIVIWRLHEFKYKIPVF